MRTAEIIKQDLQRLEDVYVPKGDTARHIKGISVGMIVGPTCVGKSTVIKEVTTQDKEFSVPGGFTSRDLRASDAKTYRHMENDPATLERFLRSVRNGEPVEYFVYETGNIYGSQVQDYTTPFSVLDTSYRSVDHLKRAGFKSAMPIALAVHPDQYVRQFNSRFRGEPNTEEARIRLTEAQSSLEWALEQEDDISWVLNRPNKADQAAREVIGLVRGYFEPLSSGRLSGQRLLKRIKQIKNQ